MPRRLGFYLINNRGLMKTFKLGTEMCFRKNNFRGRRRKDRRTDCCWGLEAAKKMVPQMEEDMNKVWIGNGNGEGRLSSRGIYELESTELETDWMRRVGE